jgi:hypothetical protein
MNPAPMMDERHPLDSPDVGFEPETKRLMDFSDEGALDPVKVLRVTLEVGFSHARMILKTGRWSHSESKGNAGRTPRDYALPVISKGNRCRLSQSVGFVGAERLR